MDDGWDTIDRLSDWIDQGSTATATERRLLRIMKLQEEAGEVAQAAMEAIGENPRKGFSHTWDDVDDGLCDVIIAAMVALRDEPRGPQEVRRMPGLRHLALA